MVSPFEGIKRPKSTSALLQSGGKCKNTPCPYSQHPSLNVHSQPNEPMMQEIPTPIKWNKLEHELEGYDKGRRTYLVNGFRYGFSIGCVETPTTPLSKNHKSALKHKKVIENHIQKSLSLGRIVGPFSTPRYTPFVSFP